MARIFRPLYWLGKTLAIILCKLLGKWRVYGAENVPETGGVVIAPNHASYLDPPVAGAGFRRYSYFMGKKELFKVPIFGTIIRNVGCFPVDRQGQDRKAVKFAIQVLKDGNPLVIFPEGGRTRDGELQEAGIGAALLANRAGVPVVPAYIKGTRKAYPKVIGIPRRADISVTYGKPISTDAPEGGKAGKARLREITDEVMSAIACMKAESGEREP